MFQVTEINARLAIHPNSFGTSFREAAADAVESKYLDTVVDNMGLVVALQSVDSVSHGEVLSDEGSALVDVKFRLCFFRPWVDEVIHGTIAHMGEYGVSVTLGFFDDIVVPSSLLPKPHEFRNEAWTWFFIDEKDGCTTEMPMELGDTVAVRVCSVRYRRRPPHSDASPAMQAANALNEQRLLGSGQHANTSRVFPPMEVVATMDVDGLGPVVWWREEDEEDEEEEA